MLKTFLAIGRINRHFSTLRESELLTRKIHEHTTIDRFSPGDNRASKLIEYVRLKKYSKALDLVEKEGLNPNSHSWSENTVLTDCAKRGDVEGVKFALNKLKCSITVSCQCPKHRSCFHYASLEGHLNVLYELYKFSNENNIDVNLLDSDGKTHLDVAKDENTKKYIESYKKSVSHCQLSGSQIFKLKAPNV